MLKYWTVEVDKTWWTSIDTELWKMQDGAIAACLKYYLRRYMGRHETHKNTRVNCILAEIQTRKFPDTLIRNVIIKEEQNVC